MANPEEIVRRLSADKARVMETQRQFLERRYNVARQTSASGAHGASGARPDVERLAWLSPEDIRTQDAFPYPSLPHPLQTNGGQVFPKMQILMFPRLERFDVDFDCRMLISLSFHPLSS